LYFDAVLGHGRPACFYSTCCRLGIQKKIWVQVRESSQKLRVSSRKFAISKNKINWSWFRSMVSHGLTTQ
jgi:hypothetical protein